MSGRFTSNLISRKQLNIPKNTYHKLTHDKILFIKEQFDINDTDKSRQIDIDELKLALDKILSLEIISDFILLNNKFKIF